MSTFGTRPEDVVTDGRGNVLTGVTLKYYATKADALADVSALGTVVTVLGRWSVSYGGRVIWVRTPAYGTNPGDVYPVASDIGAQTVFVRAIADDPANDPAITVYDNDLWVQY